MKVIEMIKNYCEHYFGYDRTKDEEEFANAKETMSQLDLSLFNKNSELKDCIIDNFSWKYFTKNKDFNVDGEVHSLIELIYEYGIDNIKSSTGIALDKLLKVKLYNISKNGGVNYFKDNKEGLLYAIELYYFHLGNMPNIDNLCHFKFTFDEITEVKVKDSLYPYPEFEFIDIIVRDCNISRLEVFSVFEDLIYDYATYSVGDTNSDMREEFLEFFEDELKDRILKDKVDDQYKINELLHYRKRILKLSNQLTILEYAKKNPEFNDDLSEELSSMKKKIKLEMADIPEAYNDEEKISEKLEELRC